MNVGAVFRGLGWLIQTYFAPTPQQKAAVDFAGETWLFVKYCAAYSRLRQLEDAGSALAQAYGGIVTTGPNTGHVEVIEPKPAPARQSPGDFNNDPRNR